MTDSDADRFRKESEECRKQAERSVSQPDKDYWLRLVGSYVTVTSHSTGRSVTVRINDRGPFVKGRCINLSDGAARVLGMSGARMVSLR
jgi:Lytic transglycolase